MFELYTQHVSLCDFTDIRYLSHLMTIYPDMFPCVLAVGLTQDHLILHPKMHLLLQHIEMGTTGSHQNVPEIKVCHIIRYIIQRNIIRYRYILFHYTLRMTQRKHSKNENLVFMVSFIYVTWLRSMNKFSLMFLPIG